MQANATRLVYEKTARDRSYFKGLMIVSTATIFLCFKGVWNMAERTNKKPK